MLPSLTARQHRGLLLPLLFLVVALLMPATVGAQDESTNGTDASEDVATQIKGDSRQKRVAGPKASCRAFSNGVTYKRGGVPGKGVVRRDFGAGNGDKGDLIFSDAETGTALFWTEDSGYLSVYIAALVGDLDDIELVGLLFEAAPGSMARRALSDRLTEQAATAGVTQEQLFDTLGEMARALDGGCLWSSRFVPRKNDRGQVVSFWEALVGEPGAEPAQPQDDRFMVEVIWQDFAGAEQAVAELSGVISNDDGALEYFFEVDDTDLLVKLLDACTSNDHFWVFAASATDVAFDLTVTDTQSGETKTYVNPLAQVPSVTDTIAFATCP